MRFFLLAFILYVPVNSFSVMLGWIFLGWTNTKQGLMCLAKGHNTGLPMRLETCNPLIESSALPLSHCSPKRFRYSYARSSFRYPRWPIQLGQRSTFWSESSSPSILSACQHWMLWQVIAYAISSRISCAGPMGIDVTKPVFVVSDQVRLKPYRQARILKFCTKQV